MRIEAISDGDNSSATFVLNNLAKHSKHKWSIVQYDPELDDCDLVYVHVGALLNVNNPSLLDHLNVRRDLKWVAGLRGELNYKKWAINYYPCTKIRDYIYQLDAISCSNNHYVKEMSKFGLKTYHCPSGVDMNHFVPTDFPEEFTVGFVGDLDHGEKRYGLFKALPFNQKTSNYPVWIPHKDMPKFYESISVLVCCSWSEGSPVPPKEAAACGKPTVAFRVGDLEEWLPQECLVDDYDGLVSKLNELNNNYSLLNSYGEVAYNNVRRYDYSQLVKVYDSMFDEVMKISSE